MTRMDCLCIGKDGHDVDFDFKDKEGKERHVETSLHIVSNSATADNPYKYEIYECNHPFKGIKLNLPDGYESGFSLLNIRQLQRTLVLHRISWAFKTVI